MPIPTHPQADLVLIQHHLLLGHFEGILNEPTMARHPHEFVQTNTSWSQAHVTSQVIRVVKHYAATAANSAPPQAPTMRTAPKLSPPATANGATPIQCPL